MEARPKIERFINSGDESDGESPENINLSPFGHKIYKCEHGNSGRLANINLVISCDQTVCWKEDILPAVPTPTLFICSHLLPSVRTFICQQIKVNCHTTTLILPQELPTAHTPPRGGLFGGRRGVLRVINA